MEGYHGYPHKATPTQYQIKRGTFAKCLTGLLEYFNCIQCTDSTTSLYKATVFGFNCVAQSPFYDTLLQAFVNNLAGVEKLIGSLFIEARRNIRYFVNALGEDYKLPDILAKKLAIEIQQREKEGNPLRFYPVIAIDDTVSKECILSGLLKRRQVYEKYNVHKYVEPRFFIASHPFNIDVLIIDTTHVLFCLTTTNASNKTQVGIHREGHPQLFSEMIDWFDKVICKNAITFEEFKLLKQ